MTSSEYERRVRQAEIDRITARYAEEAELGRNPDPRQYLTQYPQYAAELADFIVTYHLALADLPEPDETPAAELSPTFARALAAIHAQGAQAAPAFAGLAERAFDVGLDPERVAERAGVSPSFIARLDARAVAVTTIPTELFRRLAAALDTTAEAVIGFLSAGGQPGGAFFYASQTPESSQDDFLSAIEASDDLDPARKAEWRAISERGENG